MSLALALLLSLTLHDVAAGDDAALRALRLGQHGEPVAAWNGLLDGLLDQVLAARWEDDEQRAAAEVSALVLADLSAELQLWPELADLLPTLRPWPAATPPRLAFLLDRLLAEALRRTGRADRARAVIDDHVVLTDFYVAGPFDNERGRGFDVSYPPESAFDRDATLAGKERPVRWRLNPGRHHPMGEVDLGASMRPATQSVAYAATALHSEGGAEVVLRLGTTCAFKVFLGGQLVAARKVERPLAPDQDLVRLPLRAGWNQLLIKLAAEEGPCRLLARVTHLDGRSAREVEPRSAFCAWPGPPPDPESIAWWALEAQPWSVAGLAGGPASASLGDLADAHADHEHDEGQEHDQDGAAPPAPPDAQAALAGSPTDAATAAGKPTADHPAEAPAPGAPPEPAPSDPPPTSLLSGGVDPGGAWTWPVPPGPFSGSPMVPEARDVLARGGPALAPLAAVWQLLVHPDDRVDRSALPFAEAAVAAAPDDPLAWFLLAQADEVPGQARNEREVNRRLAALERVVALDAEHVAARLELARFYTQDNPQPDRAGALLQQALEAAPGSQRALLARAAHLADRRRTAEADLLRQRAEATAEGRTTSAGRLGLAHRLVEQGDAAQALGVFHESWTRDALADDVTDGLVEALVQAGRHDEALFIVELSLQADPFDLARMLHAARRFELEPGVWPARSRELLTRALDVCPEHEGALNALVRCELRRGDVVSAARVLEELLRLDPGATNARRHLALLTSAAQERFEDPWRWDARPLAGTPRPGGGNDPLEVLRRTVVWRVHADGTEHRYEHLVLRVLNAAGARLLDTFPLAAGPDAMLHVHQARVIRADGRVEAVPGPRGAVRNYDLPPLDAGDLVDLEWRADQARADVFGPYFGTRHLFQAERPDPLAPVRWSELVVIAPADLTLHVATRNAATLTSEDRVDDAGRRVLRWVATDLPRLSPETAMPDGSELQPLVDVTTYADWNAFARWWWSFIEKEFVTTDAMRAKVAELVAGTSTELEAIQAIARFVGQEIRYNAWAFGTHGYEPYSAPTIFERRFGDCKDKSILLRQMLAEIGVEALPVLINAEWRRADEPLDAAMVGHFNHCIAWLPPTDGRAGMYLDATADLNPIDYLRADDQGARVLHVSAEGGRLADIPYATAWENRLARRYAVTLDGDGHASVELRDESTGHYGVMLRSRYGGQPAEAAARLGAELAGAFGPVTMESLETSDLEDIAAPAQLTARFRAASLATPEAGLFTLPVSFDDLGLTGVAKEPTALRRLDVVLDRPFGQETEVVYGLPQGARLLSLPGPVAIEAEGLLRYEREVIDEGTSVVVRRRFQLLVRRVERSDYERFRSALREIERVERLPLSVLPGTRD